MHRGYRLASACFSYAFLKSGDTFLDGGQAQWFRCRKSLGMGSEEISRTVRIVYAPCEVFAQGAVGLWKPHVGMRW